MKRKRTSHAGGQSRKKPRRPVHGVDQSANATPSSPDHPILRRFYPKLLTLRHYLLSQLHRTAKGRRRRISQLGLSTSCTAQDGSSSHDLEVQLGNLLDSTLVGTFPKVSPESEEQRVRERNQDIEIYTQQRSQGTVGGTFKLGYALQPDVVDYVIWLLFRRSTDYNPKHLLCHGFQRSGSALPIQAVGDNAASFIPGLFARNPNSSVRALKEPIWCQLHALLGKGGDEIMLNMLVECSIFLPVEKNTGNYYQLSGVPMSELKSEPASKENSIGNESTLAIIQKPPHMLGENKTPSAVTFVRSRMLYAKAALNAKGGVRFGMRHIHVLNRFPKRDDNEQAVHIMRYIFPRQFGLHNVFTSKINPRETAMPFKDYTLREKEIEQSMCQALGDKATDAGEMSRWKSHTPKRLRGAASVLVDKLRTLNHRCSYLELLRHYCPVEGVPLSPKPAWRKKALQPATSMLPAAGPTEPDNRNDVKHATTQTGREACFTDMACSTAHVSAFCRAVVSKVMPRAFWGGDNNQRIIMFWIDQFICLRKFESLTLHQVTQKLQIATLGWLRLPGQDDSTKLAKTDFDKRKEIFLEFVYWVFDSFLIPLIRSNFYVTESNVHRNRLFYFRHDVWRMLTEPALTTLRMDMFEEMPTDRATRLLSARQLGFSKIRLLPKSHGFRTIMNLKRRQQVLRNGTASLGPSINSRMAPVFNAVTYEKSLQPDRFGCSLFSVGDMFPKLVAFKASLREQGLGECPLYFAKVDVQSCFDTIPQSRLLSMVETLMSMQAYHTGKHVEVTSVGALQRLNGREDSVQPLKRYVPHSGPAKEMTSFGQLVNDKLVGAKSNTVFVNTSVHRHESKEELMQLLREHVERNMVKMGKRFYRQKKGIPQGSVLSSILCNFFYAELEADVLDFALESDSLLLRLLDDFLLITVCREKAERFVQVMHAGHADYGVVVKAAKSLTNFDVKANDGCQVPKNVAEAAFPYCGVWIDTQSLEVKKKTERSATVDVEDSLTVDLSKMPGQTFHRKALNAFKIQLKAMFIDTSLNSVATVLANVYRSFYEAAVRCIEYVRVLSKLRTTCSSLLINTVDSMVALGYVMLQRRSRSRATTAARVISRRQVQWLATKAFQRVFQRRQTQHGGLLKWLRASLAAARISSPAELDMLAAAIGPH